MSDSRPEERSRPTVTFVGSGDAFGSGGRYQTCMAVRSEEAGLVLVDCGATSLTAMKSTGLDPGEVSAVVISHLHGDHFGGLPFLVLDGQFSHRERPLRVIGPPGLQDRLTDAMENLFPGSSTVKRRFDLDVIELDPGGAAHGGDGFKVRAVEVDHACGAPPLAVALDIGGRQIAYSGDTAWTPALLEVSRGADLFIVEAYTWERPVKLHLDYQSVHRHHDDFAAEWLLLTHMSQDMLAHAEHAEIPAAHDGLIVTLWSSPAEWCTTPAA